jgi:hypothetical protein
MDDAYKQKIADARAKFGRDFITAKPSPRQTEKSWRLKQIESAQNKTVIHQVINISKTKGA